MTDWREIIGLAEAAGLEARGGFHCAAADGVPKVRAQGGAAARSLILLGGRGGSLWPAFSASPEYRDSLPDAMDRWSRRVIDGLAAALGAEALFPFGDPPYLPFLRWAMKAEPIFTSPLGMAIHPELGLWHSYRGALALAETVQGLPEPEAAAHPCESCAERPCLTACPVGAFTGDRYQVEDCVDHITSQPGAACMSGSCLARQACPVGRHYHYNEAQSAFHMKAFVTARLKARAEGLNERG